MSQAVTLLHAYAEGVAKLEEQNERILNVATTVEKECAQLAGSVTALALLTAPTSGPVDGNTRAQP